MAGTKREQVEVLINVGALTGLTSGVQQTQAVLQLLPVAGSFNNEPVDSAGTD